MSDRASRWTVISALFDELAELPATEREQRLAAIGNNDVMLAAELRALLKADESANTILDGNAASSVPGILTDLDSVPGDGIAGPYRLLRSIGVGGMGEVWLAERTDGAYEQHVAVKLLKRGMDSNAILRRFLQERQILARLHHNHIVRLIDGGMSSEGRPFYVMDFVDGQPITDYAASQALDVRARATLLARVADAVAYAHSQLIVHRDLKPSNVLVDGDGEPRVLDFGIAKLMEERDDPAMTGTGMRVLSPAYAAPEQILGEPIGTATDVYALGLILCELLTGQLPQQRQTTSLPQLAADVSQHVMDRASVLARHATATRIAEIYGKNTAPKQISQQLSGDLDLIVATALQREPSRRYQTASALADDLRRWLDGRPISARADSTGYRFNRFVRRHRVGVAATVLVALSLIGGLGAALYQAQLARAEAQRADTERSNAERQLARTERVKDFILTLFREQDPISRASVQARTATAMIRDGVSAIDGSLSAEPELQAQLLKDLGEIQVSLDDRETAQATLQRAWEMQSGLTGPDSIESAEALAAYGEAVYAVGDTAKAATLLRDALNQLRKKGAGESPRAALAESSLANVELIEGNKDEAERLAQHSVEVFRTVHGKDDTRVAMRLGVLGKVQQENSKYAEALASYDEALRIVTRNSGDQHVRTALLRTNVGDVLRLQRKYEEAADHYETALRIERVALPADHVYIGGTLLRLGDLQRRMGQFDAAERSFAESLSILAKTPSGQYAQALQTYGNLARAQGHFDVAAQRYRKSFGAFQAATGDSVYTWLTALLEVSALTEAERFSEADALGGQATSKLAEIAPDDDYNKMYAASVMGALRQAENRHSEAIPLLRNALSGVEGIYGKEHAEAVQTGVTLAASLLASRDVTLRDEASLLIESAIDFFNRAGDTGSEPMLGVAYLQRSKLHAAIGDHETARSDLRMALSRLQVPEYARMLREGTTLARALKINGR